MTIMPLQINSKMIDSPYFLAPMAGITNAPFRLLMREMGAAAVVSELVSATGICYGGQKTMELCSYFEEERPIGLQIFGEDSENLAKAAQVLEQKGVDFIDINLGCPVPKVVSRGAGAAMLKNPLALHKMLSHVKQAIRIPLTVKMRTGWDANSINIIECVQAAAEAGVAWVAIHGRTRAQGYEGFSDWDLMAKVKARSSIPIIGNGDILTAEHAIKYLKESGVDAVMIGRGALRNPFIFLEIAQIEGKLDKALPTYWELITRHTELLRRSFNDFFVGIQLRKFLTWYAAGIEGASSFRKALYEIKNDEKGTAAVMELGQNFFDRPGICKQSSFLKEPFLKGGHG